MTDLRAARPTVAGALFALLLAGCGAAATPTQRPPPAYPGALVAPSQLRSPPALGEAFALDERVRAETPRGNQEFRAVLQKRGDTLVLVGLGPHGGRGFVLTERGDEVDFESHLPEELPFPPRFILHDIQRACARRPVASRRRCERSAAGSACLEHPEQAPQRIRVELRAEANHVARPQHELEPVPLTHLPIRPVHDELFEAHPLRRRSARSSEPPAPARQPLWGQPSLLRELRQG